MSVPTVPRKEHHHRQIDLRFYHREDGLFEVEGRLIDRKTVAFRRQLCDVDSPPGDTLHDITVTLVFDDTMQVLDARARMQATRWPSMPPGSVQIYWSWAATAMARPGNCWWGACPARCWPRCRFRC